MSEIAQQAEETVENIEVNVEGNMENIEKQLAELKSRIEVLDKKTTEPKVSMIVFSGDLDKVLASFIIATGSVAMGMEVVMFFTFWGTPVLRDKNKSVGGKDIMGKMFGTMLPKGTETKVEDFDDSLRCDHHVSRLEVTVNHAALVSRFQRLGDLPADFQSFNNRQRVATQTIGQRCAIDEFEYQKAHVVRFIEPVNRRDIRMIE